MDTKMIPAIITLTAAGITSVMAFILQYPLNFMLWVLLGVIVVFYAIGCGVKTVLDRFETENAERIKAELEAEETEVSEVSEEGNVVEKETATNQENLLDD